MHFEMKRLLKYLFPAIAAFVFWNCTDAPASAAADEASDVMSFEERAYRSAVSESESELCLPRQISSANSQRVQSTARRTVGAGRSNFEFVRSGKVVNADIRYSVQRNSILIHSALIEPANRLLCLSRLII